MKKHSLLRVLLLFAITAYTLSSCQKEKMQSIEGLNAVTHETAFKSYGVWLHKISEIYFYSDLFPMRSLIGSKVTVHSTSDIQLMLCQTMDTTFAKKTSVILNDEDIFFDVYRKIAAGVDFPNCSEKSVAFILFYFPPPPGEYEFFLQIENPEQGIYYRTPTYRYTIAADASNNDWYRTSITEI